MYVKNNCLDNIILNPLLKRSQIKRNTYRQTNDRYFNS